MSTYGRFGYTLFEQDELANFILGDPGAVSLVKQFIIEQKLARRKFEMAGEELFRALLPVLVNFHPTNFA